ncbi:MAG: hypothetical protein ACLGPL_05185 [Acidobacteriota bacterium]
MKQWFVNLLLSLLVAFPIVHRESRAETVSQLNTPVETGSSLTYRKLVEGIFKGVREDPKSGDLMTASEKVIRRPGAKERTVLPEGSRLNSFEVIRVRGDGRRYFVMLLGVESEDSDVPGGGASVLAVFPEGSAEPQDVAEVKSDMFCGLGEGALLSIGPDEAFTYTNSHHNSSQGYLITTLAQIHGGRLQRIAEVFTLRNNAPCDSSFEEPLTWRTESDSENPYPKVVATVTLIMGVGKDDGGDCPKNKKAFRKQTFQSVYRWDKAKGFYLHEPGDRGFDALDRFNQKNM